MDLDYELRLLYMRAVFLDRLILLILQNVVMNLCILRILLNRSFSRPQ